MIRKLLVALTLTMLFTNSTSAMTITKGKLISHKEWTSSRSLKASFKEANQLGPTLPSNHVDGSDTVVTSSQVSQKVINAAVNTDVNIRGLSNFNIYNFSTSTKTYTILTTINVTPPCNGHSCMSVTVATSQDVVSVDPNGMVIFNRNPAAEVHLDKTGMTYYYISTLISIDGSSTDYISSSNTGYIQVS